MPPTLQEIRFLSDSDEKFASRVRAGAAEISEVLALIPAAHSPVELAQQISKLFHTAIHHGAQIWNEGSHIGCCELYHFAASQLLQTAPQTNGSVSTILRLFLDDLLDPLREPPTLTNAPAKAWELRHRFDRFEAVVGIEELTALTNVTRRRATPPSVDDIRNLVIVSVEHGMSLYHVEDWLGCALLHSFCAQQIVALAQIKPINREAQLLVHPVGELLEKYPGVPLANDLAKVCAWDFYNAFQEIIKLDHGPLAAQYDSVISYRRDKDGRVVATKLDDRPQYDAVISYRREGGSYLARAIHQAIKDRGHQTFLDVDELHAGDFPEQLRRNIENSPSLILLLTRGALDRCCQDGEDWVRREILHAREHGKIIIPVMAPKFKFPKLPPELEFLRDLQGVPVSDDFFEAMIDRLIRLMSNSPRR